ncbi:hypothetical protein BJ741DRAFT_654630 [Chytriomyces cf. hyalinus JEL632]|nr:hypothetical protein BJ741DRAFT_654630 [Chytriomyces cf. hyalinus JEL632]
MNCNEDIIFFLFKECDPTSMLPLSTPCLADAYHVFLDFGKKRWWRIFKSVELYHAVKNRSAWFEEFKISPQTVNYIFKLYNGAVYDDEIHGGEMIFGIVFGPDVHEDSRLEWLQEKFGKEFPWMNLVFLTERWSIAPLSMNSANKPRFTDYDQIPLGTAIKRALRGLSRDPGSKSDAGMELYDHLNRYPTDHEAEVMWDSCVGEF